jgi:hypothetical protein
MNRNEFYFSIERKLINHRNNSDLSHMPFLENMTDLGNAIASYREKYKL